MALEQYLLFCGESFYASGGWGDFKGSFATVDLARTKFTEILSEDDYVFGDPERDNEYYWYHIIDSANGSIAERRNGRYCGDIDD